MEQLSILSEMDLFGARPHLGMPCPFSLVSSHIIS